MKRILLIATLSLLIFSCNENRSENKPLVENAVDNSESSVSGSITKGTRFSSREYNMVYQIYEELLTNDKGLQSLDNRINEIDDRTDKITSKYDQVINKSETYYNDAEALAKSVSDSISRKAIVKEIEASAKKYNLKIIKIKELTEAIDKNKEKIHDSYTLFKIRKTLPEIEKYQNAHPLKTDSLEHFIRKQNQLLNELKNAK
ncbi:hypothetical protein QE422_002458 [Chryseobacterium sp. SORGH_AS 447]|uniref:hypothetical protein n=1 Tax=Chryseobacterium sp. SORGH_AS_0447 TaxID=3041769 RepID=UPI00278421D8|nr:hypothetical protein [Chryseobacterium sp. SORGH_AS_0447]MDQ1162090.1 hypothetical protein [Chryseobacterium sp. SORGH_AS_0447]